VPGRWRELTPKSIDLSQSPCSDITIYAGDPKTLFAVYGNAGIFKSTDAGVTWVQIGNLPTPNSLGRIRVDPKNPKHLYTTGGVTGSSWGFWVSDDGGDTWTMPGAFTDGANTTWTSDIYNIVVDQDDFNHFIMSSHRGWNCCGDDAGIVESTDGGKTFIAHMPPTGMNHGNGIAILQDKANNQGDGNTWLVGGGYASGIFKTSDAGKTWKKVNSDLQDNHGGFFANYSPQGYVYIGVANGLGRSTDNGDTWNIVTMGLGGWYYGAISDGQQIYTGSAYVGVPVTTPTQVAPAGGSDEGSTWTPYNDQVIDQGPFRMVYDDKNGIIYSANWGSGAWALNVMK
jgi:photosystem II stability/assembly factor-like uncharacterized protein